MQAYEHSSAWIAPGHWACRCRDALLSYSTGVLAHGVTRVPACKRRPYCPIGARPPAAPSPRCFVSSQMAYRRPVDGHASRPGGSHAPQDSVRTRRDRRLCQGCGILLWPIGAAQTSLLHRLPRRDTRRGAEPLSVAGPATLARQRAEGTDASHTDTAQAKAPRYQGSPRSGTAQLGRATPEHHAVGHRLVRRAGGARVRLAPRDAPPRDGGRLEQVARTMRVAARDYERR